MRVVLTDGSEIPCTNFTAIDSGVLLTKDKKRKKVNGFVPHDEVRCVVPDDVEIEETDAGSTGRDGTADDRRADRRAAGDESVDTGRRLPPAGTREAGGAGVTGQADGTSPGDGTEETTRTDERGWTSGRSETSGTNETSGGGGTGGRGEIGAASVRNGSNRGETGTTDVRNGSTRGETDDGTWFGGGVRFGLHLQSTAIWSSIVYVGHARRAHRRI